jgi:hypothetical protein
MDDKPSPTNINDQRALIEAYAAGAIQRDVLLEGLAETAVPSRSDPTGGGAHIRGTRDEIERATREGLLTETDWRAIAARAETCPALLAID